MIVQLKPDSELVDKYLEIVSELIEMICGPLASYALSKRSNSGKQLTMLLDQAASVLFDGSSIPPLMYPERVFLSSQISKTTMEPLQKLWTGQDSIIAVICQSKVIRSFRLRGNITPSSIRVLIGMYKSLETACVLFIPTQHGKRMFLAERVEGTGVGKY